jgi:hypothetical protein
MKTMKMSLSQMTFLMLAFGILAFIGGAAREAAADINDGPADSGPIKITPRADTDESLFLMYVYDDLAGQFPASFKDMPAAQDKLAQMRYRVNRYHEYIKDRGLDPKLEGLYGDLLEATDDFGDFVIKAAQIEQVALNHTRQDAATTGYDAGFAGGATAADAYDNGSSSGDAALDGIAVTGITWLIENAVKSSALDDEKQHAMDSAVEDLKRKISAIDARDANDIDDLAAKYGWTKDADGRLSNPFRKLELALIEEYSRASTAPEALVVTQKMVDAAVVVPPAGIYDGYRQLALTGAALSATWASQEEIKGVKWGTAKAPSADYAIKLWEAALRYHDGFPDAFLREQKAWALAAANRLQDARVEADAVADDCKRIDSSNFLYNYAALASCVGESDVALQDLLAAMANSSAAMVHHARLDPNFIDLRLGRPDDFQNAVKVKFQWDVHFGFFNDDINLTNMSAFPITNVVLSPQIESNGRTWSPSLKIDRIEPGKTYTWENVISVPGSRYDNAKATLDCDEN